MRARWAVLLLGLGGCGGGGAALEASFAPGTYADAVSVAESGAEAPADSAGFRLGGLTPGPARIRLLRGGDTVGVLQVAALPAGSRLRLDALRIDPATGLAFPGAVRLDGAETVTVNGVRLAPEGRIPRRPELPATVLAWARGSGALLLRPDDARLPDLRVAVLPSTEVVTGDGAPADASGLAPGDSLRLEGRRRGGYVVADRLVLPGAAPADVAEGDDAEEAPAPPARPAARPSDPAPAASPPAPAAGPPPGRGEPGRGKGRGQGQGKGKGRGRDG